MAGHGVFESTDGGTHWGTRSIGLTSDNVTGFAIDPTIAGRIYVSTFGSGIFRSDDGGGHWSLFSAGLTYRFTTCVVNDPRRHVLYAGTVGEGVVEFDFFGPRELVEPVVPPAPEKIKPRP